MLQSINNFLYNDFLFAKEYRLWRHISYWTVHTLFWAFFWFFINSNNSYLKEVINVALWLPVFMIFSYPLVYYAIPKLLLKGMLWQFVFFIILWGIIGLFINSAFLEHIFIPLQANRGHAQPDPQVFQSYSYLTMTTSAASPMLIKFFMFWRVKQQEWLAAQNEKISAELQLLKSQVHPHFLFNTLNNIYSIAQNHSPKTPGMVLKLSSILSYMLYDCKAEEVRLEKDLEAMKNYADLEQERLSNSIDISWNIEGDFKTVFIAPLLMLPFLENAFTYFSSVQVANHWLGVDVFIRGQRVHFKIVHSKSENEIQLQPDVNLTNVHKRLEYTYPGRYDLVIHDEENFKVISLVIGLNGFLPSTNYIKQQKNVSA